MPAADIPMSEWVGTGENIAGGVLVSPYVIYFEFYMLVTEYF